MPKLNDIQAILLSSASCRDDGSLYPLPKTLADAGPRVAMAVAAVVNLGFAEERETCVAATVHRTDGDVRYGVFITPAGKAVIGVEDVLTGDAVSIAAPAPRKRESKNKAVIALLERGTGATTAELIAATGWLPHTTRAALTGLRKKGHAIDRSKRGDETCYRILTAA